MKYLLCEVTERFDHAYERSVYTVAKPLQMFDTEQQAVEALDLFNQFYNYDLQVVSQADLDSEFR